jgi:hypothetical protein
VNKEYRRIFKNQQTGIETTKELLQSMFIAEMLLVGGETWIVSPWISNVVLIDNRSGNFDTLNPEWGRKEIRLVEVLGALMSRGRHVTIVTRDLPTNEGVITGMTDFVVQNGMENQLATILRDELHTKGILLSNCSLMGSMNITFNGIEMNDEWIQFSSDSEDIASTRLEFEKYKKNS